jgi:hypothetical protein
MKTSLVLLLGLGLLAARPPSGSAPNLAVASAFIGSGGGAGNFSTVRAFNDMIGDQNTLSALNDLKSMFGPADSGQFVRDFDYAIADAWNLGSRANLKLTSAPAQAGDTVLAQSLIRAGTIRDGAFDLDQMFSTLFTPAVEQEVMQDLDTRYGAGTSSTFTRMGDRFFSDVSADVGSAAPAGHSS